MIAEIINDLTASLTALQSRIAACWTAITNKGISIPAATTRNLTNLPTYISKLKNPTGSKTITANGTHDVSNYASAVVNVPQSSTPTASMDITANGTYDVTDYAKAYVNVPSTPPGTGETEHAIEAQYYNQPLDVNDPLQLTVDDTYLQMRNDSYVGSSVVYIKHFYIPDELMKLDYGEGNILTTEFRGFQDCHELRRIDLIYAGSNPDDCGVPPGVVYQWFTNSLQENDPDKPLWWGGIYNWGRAFPALGEAYGEQNLYDTDTGTICINLSHLNLNPSCLYEIFHNLYDMKANGWEGAFNVVLSAWRWDSIDQSAANNILTDKGWGVYVI